MKRFLTWLFGGFLFGAAIGVVTERLVKPPHVEPPDAPPPASADEPNERLDQAKSFMTDLRDEVREDNTAIIAGSLAFYAMLSIFPAAIAAVSIYGLVLSPESLTRQVEEITNALPEDAASLLIEQLESIANAPSGGLGLSAVLGIVVALWTASSGTKTLIHGVNIVYDVEELRPYAVRRALAYAITVGAIAFGLSVIALVTFIPAWLQELGLGRGARTVIELIRWPGLFLMVVVGLGLLYKLAPNRPSRLTPWVSVGAVVAAVLWVIATLGFSYYTTSAFSSFGQTYGTLGGVIVLLLWFFLSGFVVLFGAEVNRVIEKRRA